MVNFDKSMVKWIEMAYIIDSVPIIIASMVLCKTGCDNGERFCPTEGYMQL